MLALRAALCRLEDPSLSWLEPCYAVNLAQTRWAGFSRSR